MDNVYGCGCVYDKLFLIFISSSTMQREGKEDVKILKTFQLEEYKRISCLKSIYLSRHT
jgi:hypothetical protein